MGGREAIARKEGKEKQLNGMNEDRGGQPNNNV
jgi:hypothetical protein